MNRKIVVMSLCFLFCLVACGFISTADAKTTYIKIGAGTPGGLWYMVGARLGEEITKKMPNIKTSVFPGGSVSNPRSVAKGELDVGETWSNNAYLCYQGKPPFKKAHPNLRFIGSAQTAIWQVVASLPSGIRSIKELNNKRINPGKVGQGQRVIAETILGLYGMTFDSIKKNGGVVHSLGHGASSALMQDGNLDITSACGAVIPSFIELAQKPGIRLLAVDPDIAEKACADPKLRGMFTIKIPKGVYKGSEAVLSVGILEVFLVRDDMSDDIAYELAKILYASQSLKDLYKGSVKKGLPSAFDIEKVNKGAVIPIHPGAKRYFKERGIKVK